ncbi:universal stress protein [Desulforhopalus sp. IMCC35007]|uniref:universal stress protein n=1 Tax=Desulforhopalus sp. IMCC35007 TaxID=2569543 RepID=UPI0010ADAFF5|nr:universal stress protein [Desulforhopalus sp. IMCC35007]TKB07468.1 universal stress protein [Desulforhopalus sp. IMCC35007]
MKIVVGYKGTNVGQDILQLALKHAKAFDAKVFLITSLAGGEKTTREQVTEAEENLKKAGDYLTNEGVSNQTHLLIQGRSPGEDLVTFAAENNCDSIILGVKSRSKVGKILFGSTAQFVILRAHCPVTTVK